MDDAVAIACVIGAVRKEADAAIDAEKTKTVFRQFEIGDEARRQVRRSQAVARQAEAGRDIIACGGTRRGVPLKHQHIGAGAREIGSGRQAVQPSPDDNRVVTLHTPQSQHHTARRGGRPTDRTALARFVRNVASAEPAAAETLTTTSQVSSAIPMRTDKTVNASAHLAGKRPLQ
jgi:hypothetical protein